MARAYILGGLRSHIGVRGGIFKSVRPEHLAAGILKILWKMYIRDDKAIDAVYAGNAVGTGGNIARLMMLSAGIDEKVPALTFDMQCASGMAAIDLAAAKIMSGQADLIIAGGFESSSMQPRRIYAPQDERYTEEGYMVAQFSPAENRSDIMLLGAERTAAKIGAAKEEMDYWTLRSHERAEKARQAKVFSDIIVPLYGSTKDEGIKPKMSQRLIDRARPIFKGGITTAANACRTNDGAAFIVLCSEKYLQKYSLAASFELVAAHAAGGAPECSPAVVHEVVDSLLKRCNLTYSDIGAFEYNEAFAVIDVIFRRNHADLIDRYNIFGGALAYGHPYGASGAIITLHLLEALKYKDRELGVAAIAGAGGLGSAILIKRR